MAAGLLVKTLHWVAAVVGTILVAFGLGITGLVCFSGTWGFMHGLPLLLLSIPMLLVGVGLYWYAIAAEKARTEAITKSASDVSD